MPYKSRIRPHTGKHWSEKTRILAYFTQCTVITVNYKAFIYYTNITTISCLTNNFFLQNGKYQEKSFCSEIIVTRNKNSLETRPEEAVLYKITRFFFKACVRYFLLNFYLSPNDSPSESMKNVFYFI